MSKQLHPYSIITVRREMLKENCAITTESPAKLVDFALLISAMKFVSNIHGF